MKKNSDGVAELDTWDYGPEIRETLNFVVMERSGYELANEDYPPNSIRMEMPEICGSGTLTRQLIREGKPTKDFLDEKVRKYIDDNNLYRK